MPLYVTWEWKCAICGDSRITGAETSPYTDEMAIFPDGWVSDLDIPEEYREHPCWDICIACPDCKGNTDWDRYVVELNNA